MLSEAACWCRILLPSCRSSWRRSFGHHREAVRRVLDRELLFSLWRWALAVLEHIQILVLRRGRWILWADVGEFAFAQVLKTNLVDAFEFLPHLHLEQWSPKPRRAVSSIMKSRKAVFGLQTQDICKTHQLRAIRPSGEKKWLTDHRWFVHHLSLRCKYTEAVFSLAL